MFLCQVLLIVLFKRCSSCRLSLTGDDKFILKTVSVVTKYVHTRETALIQVSSIKVEFLQKILPGYNKNLRKNPETLSFKILWPVFLSGGRCRLKRLTSKDFSGWSQDHPAGCNEKPFPFGSDHAHEI